MWRGGSQAGCRTLFTHSDLWYSASLLPSVIDANSDKNKNSGDTKRVYLVPDWLLPKLWVNIHFAPHENLRYG